MSIVSAIFKTVICIVSYFHSFSLFWCSGNGRLSHPVRICPKLFPPVKLLRKQKPTLLSSIPLFVACRRYGPKRLPPDRNWQNGLRDYGSGVTKSSNFSTRRGQIPVVIFSRGIVLVWLQRRRQSQGKYFANILQKSNFLELTYFVKVKTSLAQAIGVLTFVSLDVSLNAANVAAFKADQKYLSVLLNRILCYTK